MAHLSLQLILIILSFYGIVQASLFNPPPFLSTCHRIAAKISSASAVFYPPLSPHYAADISHFGGSSTQHSTCSVEPGSVDDVSSILRILGETRTPFAVKGGGHATNPGFSSTPGVQIAMSRFSAIKINTASETVDLGAGLIWDDVYAALDQHALGVLGGRVSGIGVAGFTLGGGYAWKSNQFGLAIDNVREFEVVLPNGSVVTASEQSNPNLFFGLKGGYNNFGIVSKFTINTFPQSQVWGGQIVVLGNYSDEFAAAVVNFSATVTDPKASILSSYDFSQGQVIGSAQLFYDGPSPPSGIFDRFLAIPTISSDISTRSFYSLVHSINGGSPSRVVFNTVSFVQFTPDVVNAILNETSFWGNELGSSISQISISMEPFLPNLLTHGSPSAYPPTRETAFLPACLAFEWLSSDNDNVVREATRQSVAHLTDVATSDRQDISDAPLYSNYAIAGTPVSRFFGSNTRRLRMLKQKYDSKNVMGLAGGWKFE